MLRAQNVKPVNLAFAHGSVPRTLDINGLFLQKKAFIFTLFTYNNASKKVMRQTPKTLLIFCLAIILAPYFFFHLKGWGGQPSSFGIRPSILAGTWYPGNPDQLAHTVRSFLSNANFPPTNGTLKAIIVPHAGYRYSGQIAAYAYRLLEPRKFKRIILVGPSHRIPFRGVSVNLQSGYQTPLGIVKVDVKTAREILKADPAVHFYKDVHRAEHSLEIQLPFLQTVLKDFSIVPILMGTQDLDTCKMLSNILTKLMPSLKDTLLVASSDLSHYHGYSDAKRLDSHFIKLVGEMNPEGLYEALRTGECEACGGGPVVSIMLTCRALGARKVVVLKSANSGDVTGEKDRVVGYMAGAIFTSSGRDPHPK